jgi:hypothetical protein
VLHDHDQFTDWLSPGPVVDWKKPFAHMMGGIFLFYILVLGLFSLMGLGIAYWDPSSKRYWVCRDTFS